MKINRKPLEVKPRKLTFMEWVLASPKAFAITWRIALITPCVMFGAGVIAAISYKSGWVWPSLLMFVLAMYNLWRNRSWFSTETTTTIGGVAFGIKVEKEAGDPDWVNDISKSVCHRETLENVQFVDDKEDLREVEKK
jgi:hypothetical protein